MIKTNGSRVRDCADDLASSWIMKAGLASERDEGEGGATLRHFDTSGSDPKSFSSMTTLPSHLPLLSHQHVRNHSESPDTNPERPVMSQTAKINPHQMSAS